MTTTSPENDTPENDTTGAAVECGRWDALGVPCRDIRQRVFVSEQGVPEEEEIDEQDADCLHFLLRFEGQPCGTARLLDDGHIGRVALLAACRGRGLGRVLMQAVIDCACIRGMKACLLNAQTDAIGFYEALGFKARGEVFMEAGIAHREMQLTMDSSNSA